MPDVLARSGVTAPLVLLTVCGLVLTGCSQPAEVEEPIAEPEPTGMLEDPDPLEEEQGGDSASPSPADDQTTVDEPIVGTTDIPDLAEQCFIEPATPQVERVTYTVPSSWQVEGSCEILDPELEQLPTGTETDAAIVIDNTPVAYGEVVQPGESLDDVTAWLGARAGYQAQRQVGTSTGAAQLPEGTPVLSWMFDLDVGADDEGGTFTISTTTQDEQVRAVADAIAETVVIQPPADRQADNSAPESLAVILVEAGDRPFAVTFDGDCFALRPGGAEEGRSDQECDLDPTEAPIVARVLGGDVVVGHAPAASIAVQADGLEPPYGIAANVEGGTVFAFRVDEVPEELTALGKGGEALITTPVP